MTEQITIDPDALLQASRDLADAGSRISDLAETAGGVGVSAQAFGSMNSYLGTAITDAARETTDLLRTAGDVVAALGVGAHDAAEEWIAQEEANGQAWDAAAVDLRGAQEIL